jgi:hypothetical protein
MDKRLEEQLERVWRLSERVAQIHEQLALNTALLTRDRTVALGPPLHEVPVQRQHSLGEHADRAEAADQHRRGRRRRRS